MEARCISYYALTCKFVMKLCGMIRCSSYFFHVDSYFSFYWSAVHADYGAWRLNSRSSGISILHSCKFICCMLYFDLFFHDFSHFKKRTARVTRISPSFHLWIVLIKVAGYRDRRGGESPCEKNTGEFFFKRYFFVE